MERNKNLEGFGGHKHSDESKKKMPDTLKANWADPKYRETHKNQCSGLLNESNRKKTRETLSKRFKEDPVFHEKMLKLWNTEERKKKVSEGVKETLRKRPEIRQILSEKMKERMKDPIERAKLFTEEHNESLSKSLIGHTYTTPAQRELISANFRKFKAENPEKVKLKCMNDSRKRKVHDNNCLLINEWLNSEGIFSVCLTLKPIPDIIAVDFENKRVYAIEPSRNGNTKISTYFETRYTDVIPIKFKKTRYGFRLLKKAFPQLENSTFPEMEIAPKILNAEIKEEKS